MKEILMNILMILYGASTMFILGAAILLPFTFGMKDSPSWIAWVIYPLSLIIMATQKKVLFFFEKYNTL